MTHHHDRVLADVMEALRVSEEHLADATPGQWAIVDQAMSAVRETFGMLGIDTTSRDELLAVAAGATFVHSFLVANPHTGVGFAVDNILASVGRLLPAERQPGRTWQLRREERPFTLNGERKMTPRQRAAAVKLWREDFAWLAKEQRIPRLDQITVTATPLLNNRAGLQDVGGCFPCAKAAIDGLKDARVVIDDGPDHVIALAFDAPVIGRGDAFVITIQEVADATP